MMSSVLFLCGIHVTLRIPPASFQRVSSELFETSTPEAKVEAPVDSAELLARAAFPAATNIWTLGEVLGCCEAGTSEGSGGGASSFSISASLVLSAVMRSA